MQARPTFTVFATPIGECALAWTDDGLAGVWLPEQPASRLRHRVRRRLPDAVEADPGPARVAVVEAIVSLLEGHAESFDAVRLGDAVHDPFDRRVWAEARRIPPGRVVTYVELARRLGPDATARAVGQSLGRNPFPLVVPCHRIVAADGTLGGFSAPGGTGTKRRLLTIENARLDGPADLFDTVAAASAHPNASA